MERACSRSTCRYVRTGYKQDTALRQPCLSQPLLCHIPSLVALCLAMANRFNSNPPASQNLRPGSDASEPPPTSGWYESESLLQKAASVLCSVFPQWCCPRNSVLPLSYDQRRPYQKIAPMIPLSPEANLRAQPFPLSGNG